MYASSICSCTLLHDAVICDWPSVCESLAWVSIQGWRVIFLSYIFWYDCHINIIFGPSNASSCWLEKKTDHRSEYLGYQHLDPGWTLSDKLFHAMFQSWKGMFLFDYLHPCPMITPLSCLDSNWRLWRLKFSHHQDLWGTFITSTHNTLFFVVCDSDTTTEV